MARWTCAWRSSSTEEVYEKAKGDLGGTEYLLYPEKNEEQHRGYQDYVRDDAVAVFGGHAPGVEEPEERYRQEGQKQGAKSRIDDDQKHRLLEEEQEHRREGDPDQHPPEVDALLGEEFLRPLLGHVAGGSHRVGEEVARAVPGPDYRAGRGGPESDEEQPARDDAEALLYGIGERHEPFLIADARAAGEEEFGPDDQHRHHEDGGHDVADDQTQDKEQGAVREPRWHHAGGELSKVRSEQDRQPHDGDEHQGDKELHNPLEEFVAADDADYEAQDAVQNGPSLQRQDRKHRAERESGGRDRRAPEDEGQDKKVDHEKSAHETSEGTPAPEYGLPRRHVPPTDALGQVELDERTYEDGPEEDNPVLGPGIQRGDHIASTHAGRRYDQTRSHEPEPAPEGGRNLGPGLALISYVRHLHLPPCSLSRYSLAH